MFYNLKQSYTPELAPYEFDESALVIDTETVGAGPLVEIVEVAVGDRRGKILFESLVRPTLNRLPPPSKHARFERAELLAAPEWSEVWAALAPLIDNRLLVAYNAAFDRRALAAACSRLRVASNERGWRCALQLVKRAVGTRRSISLEAACAHFGLAGGTHRAAEDVRATCRLLEAVCGAGGNASKNDGASNNNPSRAA